MLKINVLLQKSGSGFKMGGGQDDVTIIVGQEDNYTEGDVTLSGYKTGCMDSTVHKDPYPYSIVDQ